MKKFINWTLMMLSYMIVNADGESATNIGSWINATFCTTSSCTYDKNIFPSDDLAGTITVDMSLSLFSISNFDEVAGHLELVCTLRVNWKDQIIMDPYYAANVENPGTYNFTEVVVPQDEVWKPPITVFNSAQAFNSIGHSNYIVRITLIGNGTEATMEWFPGIVTKTGCPVDVSNYPWDVQTCSVVFTPWGYRSSEIDFKLTSTEVDLTSFQGSDTWDITYTTIVKEQKSGISFANFSLELTRKPTFFLMNIVMPIELLAFLNLMVFVLPAQSGERIGYSVTVFLTFAVYVTIISDNLPKTSNPMSIFAYFMMAMLIVSAFICFITIMSLRAYIREDDDPVPNWIKVFVVCLLCKCCPRKKKSSPKSKSKIVKVDQDNNITDKKWAKLNQNTLQKSPIEADSESENSNDSDDEDGDEMEWEEVGKAIDVVFFFLFALIYVGVSFAFLTPLSNQNY